jgi:hypothetical protein
MGDAVGDELAHQHHGTDGRQTQTEMRTDPQPPDSAAWNWVV